MSPRDKPVIWLHGEVRTPPFSTAARTEVGYLLRQLQRGDHISLPRSRPMPSIGPHCHELRIQDESVSWRIIYFVDAAAVVVLEIFNKTTRRTPKPIIEACRERLARYSKAGS
jgi:phage-related protein